MNKIIQSGLLSVTGAMLLTAAAVCTPGTAFADETTKATNLVVDLRTGNSASFLLADKPVLTFSATECTITAKEVVVTYEMTDIERAYFKEIANVGVSETGADNITVDLSMPDVVTVRGMKPGTQVNVYDLQGRLVASVLADNEGSASAAINTLERNAVYVVAIANFKNFKLYKR